MPAPATASGFLFGAAPAPAAAASGGGGLFGAAPAAGGLIGPAPVNGRCFEWEDCQRGSGLWKAYDAQSSAVLAAASQEGHDQVQLSTCGTDYVISLNNLTQTNVRTKFVRTIRRSSDARLLYGFPGSYLETPSYWNVAYDQTVSIKQDTLLWREVESLLLQSSVHRRRVLEITLVCKRNMFKLYQAKKEAFGDKLGKSREGERWLWHGTQEVNVQPILDRGFLRDMNSTSAYGKGTYFARDSAYSLQPKYAVPGARGEQHLLLSRVLVGDPCVGSHGMTSPKLKQPGGVYHESMVDRLANPQVFVLSTDSDNQAYPEFVLRVAPT